MNTLPRGSPTVSWSVLPQGPMTLIDIRLASFGISAMGSQNSTGLRRYTSMKRLVPTRSH